MAEFRIGELASIAGIATSAIRYYESVGLLKPADRRHGQRVYDEAILGRLGLIDLAKRAGFTIAEIKDLVNGVETGRARGVRWRQRVRGKREELERRVAEAEQMMHVLDTIGGCECPTLADCERAIREARPGLQPQVAQ